MNLTRKLEDISPAQLILVIWVLLLVGSALGATRTSPMAEAVGGVLALASMYGYPMLVATMPQLHVSLLSRRLTIFCPCAIAGLYVLDILARSAFGQGGSDPAAWTYPVGFAAGIAVFIPFVIAARALRRVELSVGRDIALGAVSAFLWLFYWPLGPVFFHRRLSNALSRRAMLNREAPA